jgi:hypothetical protein
VRGAWIGHASRMTRSLPLASCDECFIVGVVFHAPPHNGTSRHPSTESLSLFLFLRISRTVSIRYSNLIHSIATRVRRIDPRQIFLLDPNMPSFFKTHPRACALVLASTKGSRLFPLTTPETPKHLLPVAGIPCILRLLESMTTFQHVVVAIAAEDDVTLKVIETVATLRETNEPAGVWKFDAKDRTQSIAIIKLGEDCFGPVHAIRQVEEADLIHPSSRLVIFPGDLVFLQKHHDMSSLIRPQQDSSCVALLVDVGEVDENGVPLKESAKVSLSK